MATWSFSLVLSPGANFNLLPGDATIWRGLLFKKLPYHSIYQFTAASFMLDMRFCWQVMVETAYLL